MYVPTCYLLPDAAQVVVAACTSGFLAAVMLTVVRRYTLRVLLHYTGWVYVEHGKRPPVWVGERERESVCVCERETCFVGMVVRCVWRETSCVGRRERKRCVLLHCTSHTHSPIHTHATHTGVSVVCAGQIVVGVGADVFVCWVAASFACAVVEKHMWAIFEVYIHTHTPQICMCTHMTRTPSCVC